MKGDCMYHPRFIPSVYSGLVDRGQAEEEAFDEITAYGMIEGHPREGSSFILTKDFNTQDVYLMRRFRRKGHNRFMKHSQLGY